MNTKLPITDAHYKCVKDYVENQPLTTYQKASARAIEAFNDLKFSVRIHFGLYSILNQSGESWPFLHMNYQKKAEYMQLINRFCPVNFDAEKWIAFFKQSGAKGVAFTAKHHEGFSLFDTDTRVHRRINWNAPGGPCLEECNTAFSVMESPFKRDIVKELCDAAHRHGLAIDLYYSHPDWYDADFAPFCSHPMTTTDQQELMSLEEYEESLGFPFKFHGSINDEQAYERMMTRHRRQIEELLTHYGKIDMLCFDMWLGKKVWPALRDTLFYARSLQKDCMFRARGIGNYGDYYTPERFIPNAPENTDMPWMVIHPLGRSFSYDKNASDYKGAGWIIQNLLDCTSKGGNFMVGIGPDATGAFHPEAIKQMEEAGRWLNINGQAIYGTRMLDRFYYQDHFKDGSATYYCVPKDRSCIYGISFGVMPHPLNLSRLLGDQAKIELLTPEGFIPVEPTKKDDRLEISVLDSRAAYGGDSFCAKVLRITR